jgi:hypothetical protein
VNLPLASANRSSADADTPSYSSTLRIDYENVRILRYIRLGQSHRKSKTDSFSHKAMQTDSSIRPMLYNCLLNGHCPVMSPTKILNLNPCSKYLVKLGLGFFSHILDRREAVFKHHEAQCDLRKPLHLPPPDT